MANHVKRTGSAVEAHYQSCCGWFPRLIGFRSHKWRPASKSFTVPQRRASAVAMWHLTVSAKGQTVLHLQRKSNTLLTRDMTG